MRRRVAGAVAAISLMVLPTPAYADGVREVSGRELVACTADVTDPSVRQSCATAVASYRAAGFFVKDGDDVPVGVCFGSVSNHTDAGWLGLAPRRVWTRAVVECEGALIVACTADQTAWTVPPFVVGLGTAVHIDGDDICSAQTPKVIGPSLQPLVLYFGTCLDSNGTVYVSQIETTSYP